MKTFLPKTLLLCVAGCAAFGMSARGTLIFEDTVPTGAGQYVVGSPSILDDRIHGKNPSETTGFSAAWAGSNAQGNIATATNLTFGSLVNTGGSIQIWPQTNGSRATTRAISSYEADDTLWFASLINVGSVNYGLTTNISELMLYTTGSLPTVSTTAGGALWSNTNGQNLGGFGWGFVEGDLVLRYQTDAGGPGFLVDSIIASNSDYLPSITYLLVAKLTVNSSGSDDNMQIWFLDSLPGSEEGLGVPTLDITSNIINSSTAFTTLTANYRSTGRGYGADEGVYFDALRMGTTYASVTPVPEPSLLGMLGLAGVAVFLARRRRMRLTME